MIREVKDKLFMVKGIFKDDVGDYHLPWSDYIRKRTIYGITFEATSLEEVISWVVERERLGDEISEIRRIWIDWGYVNSERIPLRSLPEYKQLVDQDQTYKYISRYTIRGKDNKIVKDDSFAFVSHTGRGRFEADKYLSYIDGVDNFEVEYIDESNVDKVRFWESLPRVTIPSGRRCNRPYLRRV